MSDISNKIVRNSDKKRNIKSIDNYETLLLNGVFELTQEIILVLDENGYIKSINCSGLKQLDYSDNELIGVHFNELIDLNHLKEFSQQFDEIIKKGNGTLNVRLQNKMGLSSQFNLNLKVFYLEQNKINFILITGINVEVIKYYEKEILELYPKIHQLQRILKLENQRAFLPIFTLKELDKLRTSFISNISHELRTPLSSIIGFAETITSDPNLPHETILEFTKIILLEGKRLARLVNNIIDLSLIQQGRLILNKSKFNIIEEIKKIIEDFNKLADEKNITIIFESNKEVIEIEADQQRIIRTISLIIHNAIKFTENFGRVYIQVKQLYREIDIVIIDTGIGINPDEIPNIFNKLPDNKVIFSENNISGFNLAYAKHIIELHKGIIDIQSEINLGTTVLIRLPK